MVSENEIYCRALTSDLWMDLEQLFGKAGAYFGCWCMYWRCTNKEFENMKGIERKELFHEIVNKDTHAPGVLAYQGDQPVGWISLSPREEYNRLVKSRVIKQFDEKLVWSIVCFFIHKDYRGRGITKSLLTYAENYAKSQGASILESYPIETKEHINELSAYVGTENQFAKVGFQKVAVTKAKGGGKKRIIMRKEI